MNVIEKTKDSSELARSTQHDSITDEDHSVLESQELLGRLSFEEKEDTSDTAHEKGDEASTKIGETNDGNDNTKQSDSSQCIACNRGDFPTGAHTCIQCQKNIHILSGCSVAIDDNEGYGTQRMCTSCHMKNQNISILNIQEVWGPKKTRNTKKKSYYLQPNPTFNLMSDTKKCKIALLKNGLQFKTATKVQGTVIFFSNTCAFDALSHALAGAYAYYPSYRQNISVSDQSDPLMEIAIALAKK